MIRVPRRPDWDVRFAAFQRDWFDRRLDWDGGDCLVMAGADALALLDVDPLIGLRGRWTTERGAMRVLRRCYAGDFERAVARVFPPCHRRDARRGDWLLFSPRGAALPSLGVKIDADALAFVETPRGLRAGYVNCSAARRAFRVGV